MKYIFSLADASCGRRSVAGGKGSQLHRLVKMGFRVPPGFVVATEAFAKFLEWNGLWPEIRRILDDLRSVQANVTRCADSLQRIVLSATFPPDVLREVERTARKYRCKRFAVRSSAPFEDSGIHSWAGQFDSFLDLSLDEVPSRIQKCWASLFNARALQYQTEAYKITVRPRFAVIVQEMVRSDWSGVAFSVNPMSQDLRHMLVEGAPGRGDAFVSGRSHSLSATLDKHRRKVISVEVHGKERATPPQEKQLLLLCDDAVRIERAFRKPVDIEWAVSGGKLFLLQVRPITAGPPQYVQAPKRRNLPSIDDYELTFKVTGLSFLFTDMLTGGFKHLEPLFTSDDHGEFCQYFTKRRMAYAARSGLRWFAKPGSVEQYKQLFSEYVAKETGALDRVTSVNKVTKSMVRRVFATLGRFLRYYSRMDNEFTDVAYLHKDKNPVIEDNLRVVAQFKDVARLWINGSVIEENSQFSRFCARLSTELDIDRQTLESYRIEEIVGLLDGKRVPQPEIDRRRLSFSMYYLDGQHKYISGEESLAFIRRIALDQSSEGDAEIKGRVANRVCDSVEGPVKIVNVDYGQLDNMNAAIAEMNKGDILVAEFTAPELLEACRKAKAIVTDIGGLLSHAAIVSRELGIPCLVGTGNATKILRNGDRILIDFTSGSVLRPGAKPAKIA